MSASLGNFEVLLAEQKRIYTEILKKLSELIAAGRAKNADRIASITSELLTIENSAATYEERMVKLVKETSTEMGIDPAKFKLSMIASGNGHRTAIDELRELVSNVARSAAEAGGVLSANVEIIEETVKVLESLDSRASGYGPGQDKPVSRISKMIDRTA